MVAYAHTNGIFGLASCVEHQKSRNYVLDPSPCVGSSDAHKELQGICGEGDCHWGTKSQQWEDATSGAPTVHAAWKEAKQ